MFPTLDRLDETLAGRTSLRLRLVCPSQEFSPAEMAHGVGRWYSGVRGLWEIYGLVAQPDLVVVMLQAPALPPEVLDHLLGLPRPAPATPDDARRLPAPATPDDAASRLAMVEPGDARRRLAMVELDDESARHLSEKFLARPAVLARLRQTVRRAREHGHRVEGLAGFASSRRMARLADTLGVPLLETPPETLRWGGKAAGRRLFRDVGVPHLPGGYRPVRRVDGLVEELRRLTARHGPGPWLLKVDAGFGSGHGNAMLTVGRPDPARLRAALSDGLRPASAAVSAEEFRRHVEVVGAVVERLAVAPAGATLRFPSASLEMTTGDDQPVVARIIGTHDQVIDADHSFVGATQPAAAAYREALVRYADTIGRELARHGVRGHVGIDFLAIGAGPDPADWQLYALEINLRQTGTTAANRTALLLTGARCRAGRLVTPAGDDLCYATTDGLIRKAYQQITPARLVAALRADPRLRFDPESGHGVVPHLWTTLTRFGKVGATVLGGSVADCRARLAEFERLLDRLSRERVRARRAPDGNRS
ncbi:hypothetical protein [Plantactinospora sp. B5E13]|uniref:hypothetical protein n=1 Tax=Plantactinospora sp. B5E13 TaxID=3153758 RepID=UPI00325E96C1